MVGITSYGVYIPWYRMSRKVISAAIGWLSPGYLPGEKAVANCDEDSITMATAAGIDCLRGIGRENVDGLYFATTTAPYRERQSASIIAGALELRSDVRTADFTNSVKSGTSALMAACEAVAAGSANQVLVCASDSRLGKVGSPQELMFGDGAGALLVGNDNVIASFGGSHSLSVDFPDHRRTDNDRFDRAWEERWIREEGYNKFIPEVVAGLLDKCSLRPDDFAKVVIACPHSRDIAGFGKMMRIGPEKLQDNLVTAMGDTGTALAPQMLAAGLEEAEAGDKILLVSFGNGCDAMYFTVTPEIHRITGRKGIKGHLANRQRLLSYEKYLVFRNLVAREIGTRGEEVPMTQLSTLYRARKSILGLCGVKCRKCETPQFPVQRVCVNPECGAIDQMEGYRFSDKEGSIFTFTVDNLAFSPSPPAMYGIVDFVGGGRYMFDFADCEAKHLKVGNAVHMSFRRKFADERRGTYSYFWKAVPRKEN